MRDLQFQRDGGAPEDGYLFEDLPPENVFGHTKKVRQFRGAMEHLRSVNHKGPLQILDIGCGSGYAVTRFLGKPGDDVLGIDMYPPNISYAEEKFGRQGLRFACLDANSLSVDRKSVV